MATQKYWDGALQQWVEVGSGGAIVGIDGKKYKAHLIDNLVTKNRLKRDITIDTTKIMNTPTLMISANNSSNLFVATRKSDWLRSSVQIVSPDSYAITVPYDIGHASEVNSAFISVDDYLYVVVFKDTADINFRELHLCRFKLSDLKFDTSNDSRQFNLLDCAIAKFPVNINGAGVKLYHKDGSIYMFTPSAGTLLFQRYDLATKQFENMIPYLSVLPTTPLFIDGLLVDGENMYIKYHGSTLYTAELVHINTRTKTLVKSILPASSYQLMTHILYENSNFFIIKNSNNDQVYMVRKSDFTYHNLNFMSTTGQILDFDENGTVEAIRGSSNQITIGASDGLTLSSKIGFIYGKREFGRFANSDSDGDIYLIFDAPDLVTQTAKQITMNWFRTQKSRTAVFTLPTFSGVMLVEAEIAKELAYYKEVIQ